MTMTLPRPYGPKSKKEEAVEVPFKTPFGEDSDDSFVAAVSAVEPNIDPEDKQRRSSATNARRHCPKFSCTGLFDTRGKRIAWCSLVFVLMLTGIIVLATSLNKVEETEYGLEYNVHNKQLDNAAKSGGLFAGPPGFEFIKFPSTFVTVDLPDGTCVSKDGLRVDFKVTFQYKMTEEWLKPCILKYRDFDKWATVVEAAGNSAVQHSCSEFEITNFQNQRGLIQSTMEDNLRLKLEGTDGNGATGVYARAISLQLSNVELPAEYQAAVADKQAAAEDIELARNQRTQETTKAGTRLLTAVEEGRKILDTARNDANVTLTEAYLRAEEIAFAFETEATVVIRVKALLNLTTDGVLAYMSNRLYEKVPSLKVSAGEPAALSRKDEL